MEVVQAARVDGLSELGIFLRIYFPMMRSTYATAFILTFMGSWNNYMWPRIVLIDNGQATMPLLINSLLTGYSPNFGAVLLGCTMCTLPILIMFLSMQKHLQTASAVRSRADDGFAGFDAKTPERRFCGDVANLWKNRSFCAAKGKSFR